MNQSTIAKAFNEWMRRYIEDPAAYEAEFNSVAGFREAEAEGREPDYGERCAAYLLHISQGVAA